MPDPSLRQIQDTDTGELLLSRSLQQLRLALNIAPPVVSITQHAYRVDWGPEVRPRLHHVTKQKVCDCALGQACPSVLKVREYLAQGGPRAADYPEDFWPAVPDQCPICLNPCQARSDLSFPGHGVGWACDVGGTLHYWEARLRPIRRLSQATSGEPRWVIPPAFNAVGEELYPGVTVADVRLAQENARITSQRWKTKGYFPWE